MPRPKRTPTYETLPTTEPLWASEPFRFFFPLGLAASAMGVLLWPLFYWGTWPFPPHFQHPRLMVFGFGGAFVCGFLGTAWPRFLEAEALRRWEVLLLAAAWLAATGLALAHQLRGADLAFGIFCLSLLVILGRRVSFDQELPPPGFTLALLAVAMGADIGFLWALSPAWLGPWLATFTRLAAWQGFLLLPVLGVGSYLFARVFQRPGEPPPTAPPQGRALGVWLGAALVLISFAVEASGWVRAGGAVRLAAVLVWAWLAVPALWRGKATNTRAWGLRVAMGSVAATFLWRALWPGPGHAAAHLLFLGGFGIAILLAADRVSHGHGGDISSLPARSKLWRWIVWLAAIIASTRISADLKTSLFVSHQIYAALLWVLVLALWAIPTAPLWRRRS